MKPVIAILIISITSCQVTEVTGPDGTVTRTKSADPAAVAIAAQGLATYAQVRTAKADRRRPIDATK